MIKAFTVSILSLFFFSSVQIALINENTGGHLGKAGMFKLPRDIGIKKGTVPGNTGGLGALSQNSAQDKFLKYVFTTIKAFTVSILSLFFFSSVQIAFINENTGGLYND
jgi:hypothetical protein